MNPVKSLRRGAFVFVFSAASLLHAAPSAAQPLAKRDAEADRLFREGVMAANAGKDDKAIALLKAAFLRDPQPDYAVNLGTTEVNMKRYRDAAEHLAMFLRKVPDMDPADRKLVTEMLTDAEAQIGVVKIRVNKDGADVLVDGIKVGTTPLSDAVYVDPGARKVQAILEDRVVTRTVEITAGSEPEVELSFPVQVTVAEAAKPAPAPLGPAPSYESRPWIPIGIGVTVTLAAVSVGTGMGSFAVGESSYKHWVDEGCRRVDPTCVTAFDDRQALSSTLGNVAFWSAIGAGLVGAATIACVLTCKRKHVNKAAVLIHEGFQGVLLSGNF